MIVLSVIGIGISPVIANGLQKGTAPPPPVVVWILAAGNWNDLGEWVDTANWID